VTLPATLRIAPTLLLSACCCCDIGWMIPDSVEDELAEQAFEQGVGIATGGSLDVEDGRVDITTPDGERLMLGEGSGAVDPRMPVFGHPDCAIGGGMVIEDGDQLSASLAQEGCDVPFEDMEAHYRKQLSQLQGAGEVKELMKAQKAGERSVVLQVEGDGTRFNGAQVMLSQDERGKTTAGVAVQLPKKKKSKAKGE